MSQTQQPTHFELFELPESFDIGLSDLSQRYRELQKAVHPDKFANASERERRLSMEKSATINEAYQVLKSPQRRARYLLELQSVSFDDEKDTALDSAFLMQQIELREALAEVSQTADPLQQLSLIMQDINKSITAVLEEIRLLLKPGKLNSTEKDSVKQLIHKMQFLDKLQTEAEHQEENLMDAL